jgi:chromate transporter
MVTPGPVVITVGFIGYLVVGFPGACIAAMAVFLPCYFFTVLLAPSFKKIAQNTSIKAFVMASPPRSSVPSLVQSL